MFVMHFHVTFPIGNYLWLRFYKRLKLPQNALTVSNFKGKPVSDL